MGVIHGVIVNFLDKNKNSACHLEEFYTFIPTIMNRWKRKEVVLMGAPQNRFMAPLTFFIVTSSVDHFSHCYLPWLSLQLPPAIQKHQYRGASATKNTGSSLSVRPWISPLISTRAMASRRTIHLWESIPELFYHNHFFSPLWDCTINIWFPSGSR